MTRLHPATVLDDQDPDDQLRLKVSVPEVLGDRAVWAWPLVGGRRLRAPANGAGVWVMFEEDDYERALWMGVRPR